MGAGCCAQGLAGPAPCPLELRASFGFMCGVGTIQFLVVWDPCSRPGAGSPGPVRLPPGQAGEAPSVGFHPGSDHTDPPNPSLHKPPVIHKGRGLFRARTQVGNLGILPTALPPVLPGSPAWVGAWEGLQQALCCFARLGGPDAEGPYGAKVPACPTSPRGTCGPCAALHDGTVTGQRPLQAGSGGRDRRPSLTKDHNQESCSSVCLPPGSLQQVFHQDPERCGHQAMMVSPRALQAVPAKEQVREKCRAPHSPWGRIVCPPLTLAIESQNHACAYLLVLN